ncbi:MAG: deoxyguanosinetriphosphate triphosphohydrolase [Frankiaceae bacterium]|nr:deoxyguanosinetriphosphate triphosphohydrolase [Frankiaceae bacterium]
MPGYDDRDAERLVPEAPSRSGRGAFQRDRARVLHSSALRRLAGKTQVVEPSSASVPRTRLTHSLECAQVGRELGAALGCDPDLVDAACLAHDLGHPPYGHNGEAALDEAAKGCGGFEGNAQSLRLLTRLEVKVPGAGLNLTRATLDAATKYPWSKGPSSSGPKYGVYDDDLAVFAWLRRGAPESRRCLETQVMDWADDVAYSVHDLEDGVVAGLIPLEALGRDREEIAYLAASLYSDAPAHDLDGALAELLGQPWWPKAYDGSAGAQVALKEATSSLIGRFCRAAEDNTRASYGDGPLSRYDADLVVPPESRAECAVLKAVTARYVMDRPGVRLVQEREREIVAELVALLADGAPEPLEPAYAEAWRSASDDAARLRVVVDQVAGLTDAAAAALHERLR